MEKLVLETLKGQWLLDFFQNNIFTMPNHIQALVMFGVLLFAVVGVITLIIGIIKLLRR